MTNSEILNKLRNKMLLDKGETQGASINCAWEDVALSAMDAAREDEAGKWEAQLKEERERSAKLLDELRGAIESMIYQYGYRTVYDGQPAIGTGGMSALEAAFWAIGWADDPHIIPEDGNTCEIQGCMQDPSSGQQWGDLYLSLCSDHSRMLREGKGRPDVKEYAIKREATRDKVTGYLPFNKPQ